jgi:hypothetical protein
VDSTAGVSMDDLEDCLENDDDWMNFDELCSILTYNVKSLQSRRLSSRSLLVAQDSQVL